MRKKSNSKRPIRFSWRRTAIFLAATITAFFSACIIWADRIIFQPPESGLQPTADMTMLEVNHEVRIAALFLFHPKARFTVLYSHGNAETLNDLRPRLEEFRRRGYNVAAYDYEGYGASHGKPSEDHCYRNIDTVYQWLTAVMQIKPTQIIIYGRSVGSGPSCWLAAQRHAAGVILESAFLSAFRVKIPLPLPFDRFPNHLMMERIAMPLLIFHGRRDAVIPFSHGEQLFSMAVSPWKKFVAVDNADHDDLPERFGDAYWQELEEFCRGIDAELQRQSLI